MGFSKFIRKYFSNIFICIVSESQFIPNLRPSPLKNGKLKERFEKVFEGYLLKTIGPTEEINKGIL